MPRLLEQDHDRSDSDKRQEVACRFLVPGRHPTELLYFVPETLDQVSILVPLVVVLALVLTVLPRRDHRLCPTPFNGLDQGSAVIPLVRDDLLDRVFCEQNSGLAHVGFLRRGQEDLDRQAEAAYAGVDFGAKAAPAAAQRLFRLASGSIHFFFAPAACGWARITVESRISHSRSGSRSSS